MNSWKKGPPSGGRRHNVSHKGVERKVQKQKETLKGDVRHSYEDSGSENYG